MKKVKRNTLAFKILLGVVVIHLAAVAMSIHWALPAATQYAAHYLCVQALAGHRDALQVFKHEVEPLNPLFKLVYFSLDEQRALIRASGLGFMRPATAIYQPGFGCVVFLENKIDKLELQPAVQEEYLPERLEAAREIRAAT